MIAKLGAPNVGVRRLVLVDTNKLVKVFYLKASFAKCCENAYNWKKLFDFNRASWDAQDLSCQADNCWKLVFYDLPPSPSTFTSVCINWISMVVIRFFSNNICPCVGHCVNGVKQISKIVTIWGFRCLRYFKNSNDDL